MDTLQFFIAHPHLFLVVVALFSLLIGSFLNVVIYRLPRMMEHSWNEECRVYLGLKPHRETEKLNLCLPLSHCPRCKHAIRPWHNIPIVSFLCLGGKCSYCSAAISPRYPLIEALTCIISVFIAYKWGLSWQTLGALLFCYISICLIFIDLDHHLLPDQLTFSLLWLGLLLSIFNIFTNSHDAIIGAIAGYAIFAITQLIFGFITGKIGMGQGDYKFLAALGAFLGWQMLPFIIMLASLSGLLFALIQMLIKQQYKSVPLAFGPYLAVAGTIALLSG